MNGVSFAILAYDDAPSLPQVAAEVHAALTALAIDFEVILVDDGSNDDTAAVAEALARTLQRVRVLHHAENRGVGAAFNTAIAASRFGVVGYVDGDGQYVPADIAALFACLREADIASGLRVDRADSWTRSLGSIVYRRALETLFGLRLHDTNSGLKLYRRAVIEDLFPLEATGAFFDAELLIKASAKGAKIVEVPIRHRARRYGRAHGLTLRSVSGTIANCVAPSMRPFRSRTRRARVLEWTSRTGV